MNGNNKKIPTVFVIFGATGDLMARRLVPALFYLYKKKQLPPLFSVVGFARRDFSDQAFREYVKENAVMNGDHKDPRFAQFLEYFFYSQGTFDTEDDYFKLARRIGGIDTEWKVCANKLFYLATPPQHYEVILRHLHTSKLTEPCSPEEGWTRVLIEKPFGRDFKEAEKLDALLNKLFKEIQVYRIDHYLAKEVLQNIMAFRFANNIFGDIWNDKHIEKIEIKVLEELDVEGRGEFFDKVGALLDVGQNHMLQALALVTMANPVEFASDKIRDARAEILDNVNILNSDEEIKEQTVRAQYKGYQSEKGVDPNSATETYFELKTHIDLPQWKKTEVYLEAGKRAGRVDKQIIVTFRHPMPCLCPKDSPEHLKNKIYFRIQPKPCIDVLFYSKQPGTKIDLEPKMLEFKYEGDFSKQYLVEYANLLLDAFVGDQTSFVSSKEAMAGWKFIDPIVTAWRKGVNEMYYYDGYEDVLKLTGKLEQK